MRCFKRVMLSGHETLIFEGRWTYYWDDNDTWTILSARGLPETILAGSAKVLIPISARAFRARVGWRAYWWLRFCDTLGWWSGARRLLNKDDETFELKDWNAEEPETPVVRRASALFSYEEDR